MSAAVVRPSAVRLCPGNRPAPMPSPRRSRRPPISPPPFPSTPAKRAEYDPAAAVAPPAGAFVKPEDPIAGSSTVIEAERHREGSAAVGRRSARTRWSRPLDRVRVDSTGRALTHQPGRAGRRQPELAQGRPARADAARGLHPPREDHALRSRAHPRAHRARARLGRARLLRVLPAADAVHAGLDVRRGRQADAGLRPLLDGARRARLDRHGARRPRLRGEVLHRRGQLGPRRQQHPGLLHPGRDEVPRPRPRRQAGAALRDAAGGDRARHVLGLRLADAGDHRTC